MQHTIKGAPSNPTDFFETVSGSNDISPPIDMDKTRQQMGLSDEFIYALLKDFNDKYETFEETLKNYLEKGNYKEARVYVHTLAGLAGTIAAVELHQEARRLEVSLVEPDIGIDISSIVETHNRLRHHISAITDTRTNINEPASAEITQAIIRDPSKL